MPDGRAGAAGIWLMVVNGEGDDLTAGLTRPELPVKRPLLSRLRGASMRDGRASWVIVDVADVSHAVAGL